MNRSCPANSQGFARIQNTLCEPGIVCRCLAQEAFRAGGFGYIVKTDAVLRELLTAVDTILGRKVCGEQIEGARVHRSFPCASHQFGAAKKESAARHEAQFYRDDESFLEGFTRFIESGLKAGNAVIVLATESHRNGLSLKLQSRGVDVAAAIEQGRLYFVGCCRRPLNIDGQRSVLMLIDS